MVPRCSGCAIARKPCEFKLQKAAEARARKAQKATAPTVGVAGGDVAEQSATKSKKRGPAAMDEAGPSKVAKPSAGTTAPAIRTSTSTSSVGSSDSKSLALTARISRVRKKHAAGMERVMALVAEVNREVREELEELEEEVLNMRV